VAEETSGQGGTERMRSASGRKVMPVAEVDWIRVGGSGERGARS